MFTIDPQKCESSRQEHIPDDEDGYIGLSDAVEAKLVTHGVGRSVFKGTWLALQLAEQIS
jgi:hypothetical protein